ncbi:MAG: Gfo/Idh/MocA family oxidoreductase [Planctomycetota bacterium]
MSDLNRREFLASTCVAGAALVGLPTTGTTASGRVLGTNDAVRVGVIGLRGRGQLHMHMTTQIEGLRLAALCDPDPAILAAAVRKAEQQGAKVAAFADVRKLLEWKDLDAVTIATPNHWQSLAAIWACQAGKDVYVEKPVSHNVWEGRQLVKAARKYRRMVQTGTQARANPDMIDGIAWLRAGNLGTVRYALGFCYNPRLPIGKAGHGEIPAGLDYDLWTGPAPLKPLRRQNLHYDWHWLYDYGNGDLGNQGIHEMDIARWCLGYQELSPRVISIGGRLGYDDDAETPNTHLVYHEYNGPPILFEVRGLPESKQYQSDPNAWRKNMDTPEGFDLRHGIGVVVVCEQGRFVVIAGGRSVFAMDRQGKTIRRFDRDDPQHGRGWTKGDFGNFGSWLAAIRSRNPQDLKAEILEGHLSSALCHTGMISHRLGQQMPAAEIRVNLSANRLLAERFVPLCEHLKHNGVDISKPVLTLGPQLSMDPQTERFLDNPAASGLLTRNDRAPFVVAEEV